MADVSSEQRDRKALEARLKVMLPEMYQGSLDDVKPVSMGSAGLKFDGNGRVAWNQMWATFCDLAMAGGPPHKGTLLTPASSADIDADPSGYQRVVNEICRGVSMVTGLPVQPSSARGWVRVQCLSDGMASWLMRAIVMENVSARTSGATLELPAGPAYRLEKEIKNVVTAIAKTSHYLLEHMTPARHRKIAALFETMAEEMPLIAPEWGDGGGWRRIDCATESAAIWTMRALVASNVVARREGTVLCVPINSVSDPGGNIVAERLAQITLLQSPRNAAIGSTRLAR